MSNDNTDQAVLAEVLNFLRRWPPHPTTAAMIRKVEAQLSHEVNTASASASASASARVWVGDCVLSEVAAAQLVKVRATPHGNLQLQIDNVESFDDKVARGDLLRHLGSGNYVELCAALDAPLPPRRPLNRR
jgi:hypothetical protein